MGTFACGGWDSLNIPCILTRTDCIWKSSSKKQERCVAEELNLVEPIQIPFSAEKGENDEV